MQDVNIIIIAKLNLFWKGSGLQVGNLITNLKEK